MSTSEHGTMGNSMGARSPALNSISQAFREVFKKSDLALACSYLYEFLDLRELFVQYFDQGQWIEDLVEELSGTDPSIDATLAYMLPTTEIFTVRSHHSTTKLFGNGCSANKLRKSLSLSHLSSHTGSLAEAVPCRQYLVCVLLALRYFFKESDVVRLWWESMRRRRFSLLIPEALPLTPGRGAGAGRSPRVLPLPAVSALFGLSLRLPFFNPLNFLVFRLPRIIFTETTQVVAPLSVLTSAESGIGRAEDEKNNCSHPRARFDSLNEPAKLTEHCKPMSPVPSLACLQSSSVEDAVYPFHDADHVHSPPRPRFHSHSSESAQLELQSVYSQQSCTQQTGQNMDPGVQTDRSASAEHGTPDQSAFPSGESWLLKRIRHHCNMSLQALVNTPTRSQTSFTLRRTQSLDNLDSSSHNETALMLFTLLGRKNWWEEVIRFLDEDLSLPLVISAAPTPETPAYPVVFLNRAFETLCQVPRDRLLGRDWLAELQDEQYSERLPLDLLHSAQSTGQCSLRAGVTLAKGPAHAERFLDLVSTRPVLDPVTSRHLYTLSVHYELCEGAQSVQCEEDLEAAEVWLLLMTVLLTP